MQWAWLENIKEKMRVWARVNAEGPYATPFLFLISFTESIFFPLPVETVLLPLIVINAQRWLHYVWITSLASVLGAVGGYAIGYFFYEYIGDSIVVLYGVEKEVELIRVWFEKNALAAAFISAFTPIPFKVFAISGGLFQAPFLLFVVGSAFGRTLRFFIIGWLTKRYGAPVTNFVLRNFTIVTVLVVVAVLLVIAARIFA